MSKEKQIEEMARALNEATFGVNKHTLADHLKPETINKVAEYLYNASYRKQEWISVEERLPEVSGIYLAYSNSGNRLVLDYSAKHKLFNSFDSYSTEQAEVFAIGVTHWMPLPEAPKMKGGAE